jgi:glycosyltransferase involved in cell wall biosynthesis
MPTPPRILFVGHDATRSGAPMMLLHLLRWLRRNTDWAISLALPTDGPLVAAYRAEVPTTVCALRPLGLSVPARVAGRVRSRLGIAAVARRWRRAAARAALPGGAFDLVYCNSVAAVGLLDRFGPFACPVVMHVHELEYVLRHMTWVTDALFLMRRHATRYIACADAVADNLVANHGVRRASVSTAYEFVDATAPQGSLPPAERASLLAGAGLPPNAAVVGIVGTVEWRKGADLLVPLAHAVRHRAGGRRICFVWVGGGRPEAVGRVEFDAAVAGLTDDVRLVGPSDRVADWCRCFDAFALLSREDPLPLAALEAGAAGVPVVCFRGGGGTPAFVRDDAGRAVPFLDVAAFADAIVEVVTTPSLRDQLGRVAADRVRALHDLTVVAPRIRDVIAGELSRSAGAISR